MPARPAAKKKKKTFSLEFLFFGFEAGVFFVFEMWDNFKRELMKGV